MSVCTRKSDGQVFVQWMENRKVRRKYFGVGELAKAKAEAYNDQVARPKPAPSVVGAGGPMFVELVNAYMTFKQNSMPETSFNNLSWKMEGTILPALGEDILAMQITHHRLDQYVSKRVKKAKISPKAKIAKQPKLTTIHRELSDIRAILNWSVRRRLIDVNPMAGYEMPTRDDEVVLPPSQEEIERIISCSPAHLQRAILLSFFLGLRPGAVELLSIRYSQINWSAMTLTVISAKKGGVERREVPIHPSLPVREWYEADGGNIDGHIITWRGKPVKSLKTAFNSAKKAAGVSGRKLTPYSLRHAFVTTLLHAGVDIHTIANISGHDVRTMLKHYAHSMDDVRQSAIDKLPALNFTAPTSAVGAEEGKKKIE